MNAQAQKALGNDFKALDTLPSTANHDNTIDRFWMNWFIEMEKLKTMAPDQYFKSDELRQCSTKQRFDLFKTNQQNFYQHYVQSDAMKSNMMMYRFFSLLLNSSCHSRMTYIVHSTFKK